MTKNSFLALSALAAILALPLLAKMKVHTQHQKGNDCKQYKTYEWLPTRALRSSGLVDDDPKTTPVIKEIIGRQLQAKGLTEVASGGDLQVATVSIKEKSSHTDALIYTWFPDYYGGTYVTTGSPIVVTSFATTGTFAVNLIDPKTKKSAWAAFAQDTVDNEKMARDKLTKAAEKMFKDFPPKKP